MRCRLTPLRVRIALVVILGSLPGLALVPGRAEGPARAKAGRPGEKGSPAWTADEVMAQLRVYPRDPYLQYVALQLARRENRLAAAGDEVAQVAGLGDDRRQRSAQRRDRVDLFSVFSGALAVQESLQLDSMRGP